MLRGLSKVLLSEGLRTLKVDANPNDRPSSRFYSRGTVLIRIACSCSQKVFDLGAGSTNLGDRAGTKGYPQSV